MKTLRLMLGCLLVVLPSFGVTQTTPTAKQIELERRQVELARKKAIELANAKAKANVGVVPADGEIAKEMQRIGLERGPMFDSKNPRTSGAVNVFPNIATPAVAGVNIEAIAQQYERKATALKTDSVMVFVSFSMPTESLKRIVRQANMIGAAVILRGFKNNSQKETARAIGELGEASGSVLVNPNAFDKYKIKAVPVVVLANAATIEEVDSEGCALPGHYASIGGDVSLDYALEQIARRSPSFEPLASSYLRQIRGRL